MSTKVSLAAADSRGRSSPSGRASPGIGCVETGSRRASPSLEVVVVGAASGRASPSLGVVIVVVERSPPLGVPAG